MVHFAAASPRRSSGDTSAFCFYLRGGTLGNNPVIKAGTLFLWAALMGPHGGADMPETEMANLRQLMELLAKSMLKD